MKIRRTNDGHITVANLFLLWARVPISVNRLKILAHNTTNARFSEESTNKQTGQFRPPSVYFFDKSNKNNNLCEKNYEKILIIIIITRLRYILREVARFVKKIFLLF